MKTIHHIKKNLKWSMLVVTILSVCKVPAQDLLVKKDSSKTQAVIDEIAPTEVKYRLHGYENGPKITLRKKEVAYILYKNGTIERFDEKSRIGSQTVYNPNKYNMDAAMDPVIPCTAKKPRDLEYLYKRKNYFGVNYLAFLNTSLGFNYMRDFRKQNLIIDVPFAFGIGKPNMSNVFYGNNYLISRETNAHYSVLKYQGGISVLFAPSMTNQTNFLIGPSFSYTSFEVDIKTQFAAGTTVHTYTNSSGSSTYTYSTTETIFKTYENHFVLNRAVYGMNLGFLARVGERINLNGMMTLGVKSDNYSEKDPFGLEYIASQGGIARTFDYKYNAKPHFNLSLSVGYRF